MMVMALRLLEGEEIVMSLKPHPLAFVRYITLCIYLMAVGVLFYLIWDHISPMAKTPVLGLPMVLLVWWTLLLFGPLIVGIFHVTFWPLLCASALGVLGTVMVVLWGYGPTVLGALTIFGGIMGLVLTDIYRRGHTYYLTNQRIIMVKEFVSRDERYLGYDNITDLVIHKGVLGHIFNFGTITPLTPSGLGSGYDIAALTVSGGVKRFGVSGAVTGARAVKVPRGRSHLELFGVPRPEEVRDKIEELRAAWRQVPYLRRIAGATEALLELSRRRAERS